MERKKFYDEFKGHKITPRMRDKISLRMKKASSLAKKGIVLDLGCRDGTLKDFVDGRRYIGLDITKKFFKRTDKTTFFVADAAFLPFRDKTFDAVFSMELIEHLFSHEKFLSEVSRILKDDGNFILSTPNIVALINRFKVLFGQSPSWFGTDSGHLHCFTFSTLKQTLLPYFEVTERKTLYVALPLRRATDKLPFSIHKLLAKLVPNFSDILLVKARKARTC